VIEENEDIVIAAKERLQEEFKESYGIDASDAQNIFKNRNLMKMLSHIEDTFTNMLREDDQLEQMYRHQGAARILHCLVNIPKEIQDMDKIDS
jgi:hypothetical protein